MAARATPAHHSWSASRRRQHAITASITSPLTCPKTTVAAPDNEPKANRANTTLNQRSGGEASCEANSSAAHAIAAKTANAVGGGSMVRGATSQALTGSEI